MKQEKLETKVGCSVIGPLEKTFEIFQKPPIFLHCFLDLHYQAIDVAEKIERKEWLSFVKNGEAENIRILVPEELKKSLKILKFEKNQGKGRAATSSKIKGERSYSSKG